MSSSDLSDDGSSQGEYSRGLIRADIDSEPSALLQNDKIPTKFDFHIEKSTGTSQIIYNRVNENKVYVCHHCNKIFLHRKQIITHLRVHAKERFYCHVCSRGFQFKSSLKIHSETHEVCTNPVTCSLCGQKFAKTTGLTKHMDIHMNNRRHKCKYCSKKFFDAGTLHKHVDRHEGVLYKCEFCGKQYTSRQNLKSHYAKHLGIEKKKPPQVFHCESCPMEFTSKHLLKVHNNKLHLSVAYGCEICEKTFSSKNNLNVHKKVHTTKFNCQVCDAKYSSREGMTVHMNKHLNVTFPCALCSKVYYLERHRTDHVLRIHNSA